MKKIINQHLTIIIMVFVLILLNIIFFGYLIQESNNQKKIDAQQVKIKKIIASTETYEYFKISRISYSESKEDIMLPTGVPGVHYKFDINFKYSDNTSDKIKEEKDEDIDDHTNMLNLEKRKYDALIGKEFSRRTSLKKHYDITAINLATNEKYHITTLEKHHVGEKVSLLKFNNFSDSYEGATGDGSYRIQEKEDIIRSSLQ